MTAVPETAYPRVRPALTDTELQDLYTPTPDDLAFPERATKSTAAAFNVVAMTRGLQALVDEGYPVTPEILARLAPYKIGHINRFTCN